MKKSIILILVCIIVIVLALGACANKGFEFRGHKIGDSIEKVMEKEGKELDGYSEIEGNSRTIISYKGINFLKSDVKIKYDFLDGKLIAISVYSNQNYSDVEKTFEELVQELEQEYGAPDSKEEDDYYKDWAATWYKRGYFLTLYVSEDGFTLLSAPSSK